MEEGRSSGCVGRGAGAAVVFSFFFFWSPYGLEVWTPGFPAMGEGDSPTPVLNVYMMRVTLSLLKATPCPLSFVTPPTPPPELQEKGTGLVGTTAWEGAGPSCGYVMPTDSRTLANYLFVSPSPEEERPKPR